MRGRRRKRGPGREENEGDGMGWDGGARIPSRLILPTSENPI